LYANIIKHHVRKGLYHYNIVYAIDICGYSPMLPLFKSQSCGYKYFNLHQWP